MTACQSNLVRDDEKLCICINNYYSNKCFFVMLTGIVRLNRDESKEVKAHSESLEWLRMNGNVNE